MGRFSEVLLLVSFTVLPSLFVNGDLYPTTSFEPTKRNAVIRGLLVSRQDVCGTEYFICETKCCLLGLGWTCCSGGTCCGPNTYCALGSNGIMGCCDIGVICSGSVGSPGTITPPTTATVPVVPTTPSARAPPSTTDILTVPLPKPTITATATQAVTPIPTDSVAQLPDKSTVKSTDPRIQYQGPGWTSAKSTCDSEVTAMKSQDTQSYLSFRFKALQGGSVFLGSSQGPDAGVYVVSLDNAQTKLDGYTNSAENNCSFTYSQRNLSAGFHNLTVSFLGASPQSSSQSQASFELNSIQLTSEDTSVQPSGGRSLLAEINCAAVFFAVLLHILSV